jgi:hypothetical protein
MKTQSPLRLSIWLSGSLFGLVVANCFLVLFVAGVDVFLGQPPQLTVPLFALLIASGSLVLSRPRKASAGSYSKIRTGNSETTASSWSRRRPSNAPAYVVMTIIRRTPALASEAGDDQWKGAVQ